MASSVFTTIASGLRPTTHSLVWFLNILNTTCAFPSIWVLSPIPPAQHQFLSALYSSLVPTTIYAFTKHLAILFFKSSARPSWIWIVAFSPAHLWCASLCLMARQQIRQCRREHSEKDGAGPNRTRSDSWWKSDSASTAICLLPAAILNAITSAAMLLFETELEKPWPQGWTLVMQGGMEWFTVVMFVGCRYGDYMLWREDRWSSYALRGFEVVIGVMGVLALFVMRSLCEALIPASAIISQA
jgi:hypothetical protein